MDEYIELLNDDSKPTGKRCLKSIAHKNGFYHATVHVWYYTNNKEVLIQKRQKTKNIYPNLWDVSVAGHIPYKENPLESAIRETEEEIGLNISKKDLEYLGTVSHKHIHSDNLIDYELHHIYIGILNSNIDDLTIQESEVADIKLISLKDLKLEIEQNKNQYVPHGNNYYKMIFTAIENK